MTTIGSANFSVSRYFSESTKYFFASYIHSSNFKAISTLFKYLIMFSLIQHMCMHIHTLMKNMLIKKRIKQKYKNKIKQNKKLSVRQCM